MGEKKVIHSDAEKKIMSLAHDILRSRSRMSLADINAKALEIVSLTTPNATNLSSEAAITTLEEALQNHENELVFEPISYDYVTSLFEGSRADYQRIMSMLSSKETAEEAQHFIEQHIQPEYDWSAKQKEVSAFLAHVSDMFISR